MLTEIKSVVLRTGSIKFHSGLNVILGDENATNSIGKSTTLMLIDFAFGGSDLLRHNHDIVKELGHHEYTFKFSWDETDYTFRRSTQNPDLISICDAEGRPTEVITLQGYTALLRQSYGIYLPDITFRALVGPYSRVWGKDNLQVTRPLHSFPNQQGVDCVDNLVKTFDLYVTISSLTRELNSAEERLKSWRAAAKHKLIPRINKPEYIQNQDRIALLEAELTDIRSHLSKYAANISEIVNKEILELKQEKDRLLEAKLITSGRLQRIQANLRDARAIRSESFRDLVNFLPDIDTNRLAMVEDFHNGLARILRLELVESETHLSSELESIDAELNLLDQKMASSLNAIEEPSTIVDRVVDLAAGIDKARHENDRFDDLAKLRAEAKEAKDRLYSEKQQVIARVQNLTNEGMRRIVNEAFGQERKSPHLTLHETAYTFEIIDDTGTGAAYSNLVVFDLTIFDITALPFLIHDSVLFKNIANDSVARLIAIYLRNWKQSFIALDEIGKYGLDIVKVLTQQSVLQLDNDHVLFVKDWRQPTVQLPN